MGNERTAVRELASGLVAVRNCERTGNDEWKEKHREMMRSIVSTFLPSGSGWDNGTTLDEGGSSERKIIFTGSFHHMNENGYYDGWTDHSIIVTPCLMSGFDVKVTGRNRNDVKDYLAEMFQHCLSQPIPASFYAKDEAPAVATSKDRV